MLKDDISKAKNTYHWGGTKTATETPGTGVDVGKYRSATFLCGIGAITNIANSPQPSWTFAIEDSSDNSAFADCETADVLLTYGKNDGSITAGVFATIDGATEDDAVYTVGYIGTKRYVRIVATAANTPGATPIIITCRLGGLQLPLDDA